ncbi:MAG TPA: mechanosensitive ion channel family protein [Gammaproteobacteria bacterium]
MDYLEWLDYEVGGNSLLIWAGGAAVFVVVWLVLVLLRSQLGRRLGLLADRNRSLPLAIARRSVGCTKSWFLLLVALYVGSRLPSWPPAADAFFRRALEIGLLLQIGLWATTALAAFLKLKRERQLSEDPGTVAALDVLGFVLRVAVWAIILLVVLDNVGVNVTAMVAGLGIGGVAVALAAQNILGDLFASLSIVLDKPFVVGDFITVDDFLGTVENVGLKTTRLRSLSGEQLVFSNNDLLSSRLRNFGRMFERRVVFSIGVRYETRPDQLRRIPAMIREAVEAQDRVRFDRAHFQKHGEFALIFETVYYVLSPDYNLFMDIQQEIDLALHERFAKEGIRFAYPTQTLYVSETPKHDGSRPAALAASTGAVSGS